jgi:hypothetical protein
MADVLTSFRELVASWISRDVEDLEHFAELKSTLDFLEDHLFHEFLPTRVGHPKFRMRLALWIASADTDEQKRLLYLMLSHLIFFGEHEMSSCFQTAYSRHTLSWLIQCKGMNVMSPDAQNLLIGHLNETLFTALTDSFPIANFIRINNIQDHPVRFVWKQGLENWDEASFQQNSMKGRKQIVIMEDFVGSGSQASAAILKACELQGSPEVLYCPMVICPKGADNARQLADKYAQLSFQPVLELPKTSFIGPEHVAGEPDLFDRLRSILLEVHPKVAGDVWAKNYGEFGFRRTGGLVVKFDNCPNNTIPCIHHKSDRGWDPLFYRVDRE